MDQLYVQYGCGFCAPKEWLNFYASPTLRFERLPIIGRLYTKNNSRFPENVLYGDIQKGLPNVNKNSCDGIFCSHVLEHLSLKAALSALSNTYDILKPGGIFRLVVPDLEVTVNKYLEELKEGNYKASRNFSVNSALGKEQRLRGLSGFLKSILGNSDHLWMWDKRFLGHKLKQSGFTSIRECFFNDSKDEMFKLVEDKDRFEEAIAFECTK